MAATPASRDRVVDAARVLCIVVVTFWHWTLSVTHRTAGGGLVMPNPIDSVPGGWLATWVLQIMPVFFLVGGYVNLVGWQRTQAAGTAAGQFVASRLRRLSSGRLPSGPLPGLAGSGQREVREFTKPGEHRCRIPGVDLADPLRRDAIHRPIAVGPEVEHQLLACRAERTEVAR